MKRSRRWGWIHPRSPKGFALPTVLAVGLIIVLVAMTIILRTLSDRQISTVQGLTLQSLMTAEAGVARIQDLLNKYPGLAAQDGISNWSTAIAALPPAPACGTEPKEVASITVSSEDEQVINAVREQNWIPVNSDAANQGQFRVSSYKVDTKASQLLLQGQYGLSGRSSNTALQVKMPLDFTSPTAGIWVTAEQAKSEPILVEQNRSLASNVFVDDVQGDFNLQAYAATSKMNCNKFVKGCADKTYSFSKSSGAKPAPPAIPEDSQVFKGQEIPASLAGSTTLTLPRPQDKADSDNNYRYRVQGTLSMIEKAKLTIKPPSSQKVILYLSENLTVSAEAQFNSEGQAEDFEVYGSSAQQNYGAKGKSSTKIIFFNSSQPVNAFIYAPEADATLQAAGPFKGGLWASTLKISQTPPNTVVFNQSNCFQDLQVGNPNPGGIKTASIRPIQSWQRQPLKLTK